MLNGAKTAQAARERISAASQEQVDGLENGFDFTVAAVAELPDDVNATSRTRYAMVDEDPDQDNNGRYKNAVGESGWSKVDGDLTGRMLGVEGKTSRDSVSAIPSYLLGNRLVDKWRDNVGRVAKAIFSTGETFIARLSKFSGFEDAQATRTALGVENAAAVTAGETVVTPTYMDGKRVLRRERDSHGRIAKALLEDGTTKIDLLDARRVVNPAALRAALGLGSAALLNTEDIPAPETPVALTIRERAVAKYKAGAAMSPAEALALSSSRLVDLIMFGDSNQLHGGNGYDHGAGAAMTARGETMYASPLYLVSPVNPGYSTSAQSLGTAVSPPSAPWGSYWISAGELGAGVTESDGAGIIVQEDSALNVSSTLEWSALYATTTTGAGSFTPYARRESSPYTGIASGTLINTNTGAETIQRATLTLTAATRAYPVKMGPQVQPVTATGPVTLFCQRIRDTAVSAGWSVTTFLGIGGYSLGDLLGVCNSYVPAAVVNYFTELRRYQAATAGRPVFVFVVNSGLNDRNATNPSGGWRAVTPGDSPAAYVDNAEAIVAFIENVWESQGWSKDELHWMIIPSHRIADPDDAELLSYRAAAKSAFDGKPRFDVVDIGLMTTQAEGIANNWYQPGPDYVHMTTAGHVAIFDRILTNRGFPPA